MSLYLFKQIHGRICSVLEPDFVAKYGMSRDLFAVARHMKTRMAKYCYIDKEGDGRINEKAYLKDLLYTSDVVDVAQQLYYPAMELCDNSLSKLARICATITKRNTHTWVAYLKGRLFLAPINRQSEPPKQAIEFAYIAGCLFVLGYKRGRINKEEWIL